MFYIYHIGIFCQIFSKNRQCQVVEEFFVDCLNDSHLYGNIIKKGSVAMTREQQKKLREIRNALPKNIQTAIKEYGFKKKDLWYGTKRASCFSRCFCL